MATKENQEQAASLEARIKQLESLLASVGYQVTPVQTGPRPDYIEFGSEKHALFLGLKHAQEDDADQIDGWALADMTAYGPGARKEFLHEILRQKVNEWKSGAPPVIPDAPEMWRPAPVDMMTTGIT